MTTQPCARPACTGTIEDGFCDVCGKPPLDAAPALAQTALAQTAAPPTAAPAASGDACPSCSTPRVAGARFCEVCRYDFETRAAGPADAAEPAPPAPTPTPAASTPTPLAATPVAATPAPATAVEPKFLRWSIEIAVDPSLYVDILPGVSPPSGEPLRTFPLDLPEMLVGRRSDGKGIHPEFMLNDPGTSRRHAKLTRRPDGSYELLDLASMNGTKLNGTKVEPGVAAVLADGDQVVVGCWTRMTVRGSN
jgi:hypothetical protein